jgi:hypothetical protein
VPELTFLGLSEDSSAILLADSRGRKYTVPLEARLRAALRADGSSTGQLEIALNALTPREIQARLRAGATVVELADETGVDEVRIERYAGPPLAEREHHASLARETAIDSHLGERTLGVLVAAAAEAEDVPVDLIRWDAWLREDGSWQILSAYPSGKADRVATWTFDARACRIWADDREAEGIVAGGRGATHRLSAVRDAGAGAKEVATEQPAKTRKPKASAKTTPSAAEADISGPAAESATAKNSDPASTTSPAEPDLPPHQDVTPSPNEPESVPQTPETEQADDRPSRKGRRASVPSWDEILFGGTTSS